MLTEVKNKTHHYFVDECDRIQGEFKEWWGNDQLFRHCIFVNGELHGECKEWLRDGRLSEHCFYYKGCCKTFGEVPQPLSYTPENRMYYMLRYSLQLLTVVTHAERN